MKKSTLDQFKTEKQSEVKKETRLTLDQFKKQSPTDNYEELEKLTGGVMATCHVPPKGGGLPDILGPFKDMW